MSSVKHKAVIPSTVYRRELNRDINYFAVKQKLKSLGLDFFNYVKPPRYKKENVIKAERYLRIRKTWHGVKKLIYALYVENYFEYRNWVKFCIIWNKFVNGANYGRK